MVRNIYRKSSELFLEGAVFLQKTFFFMSPCDSLVLDIQLIMKTDASDVVDIPVIDIEKKYMVIELSSDSRYLVLPLIHHAYNKNT